MYIDLRSEKSLTIEKIAERSKTLENIRTRSRTFAHVGKHSRTFAKISLLTRGLFLDRVDWLRDFSTKELSEQQALSET